MIRIIGAVLCFWGLHAWQLFRWVGRLMMQGGQDQDDGP